MNDILTISRSTDAPVGFNTQALKDQALENIQEFSSEAWTDHNIHDPGITILEILCFVISDLSYRLSFPMEDLLQPKSDNGKANSNTWPEGNLKDHFWGAHDALPSAPVTGADWKRLIVDMPGVKNAWVVSASAIGGASGLKMVYVESAPGREDETQFNERLAEIIRQKLIRERNLGDDLVAIHFLKTQAITISMQVVLAGGSDVEQEIIKVLQALKNEISPDIYLQSAEDLQKNPELLDVSAEQIFDGPLLDSGFIFRRDLMKAEPKTELYSSDLIARIYNETSIISLADFGFIQEGKGATLEKSYWSMKLTPEGSDAVVPESLPVLDVKKTLENIAIEIDGHQVILNMEAKDRIQNALSENASEKNELEVSQNQGGKALSLEKMTLALTGRYRQLEDYMSLQLDFPQNFGLSHYNISDSTSDERRAQIRQLQGFLLLFDQVLANQFAQLEQIKTLLSLPKSKGLIETFESLENVFSKMFSSQTLLDCDLTQFWTAVDNLPLSYESQVVSGLGAIPSLLGDYYDVYNSPTFAQLSESTFSTEQLKRLTRNYQHLLARFHEEVLDTHILKYPQVIRHYLYDLKRKAGHYAGNDDEQLLNKLVLLKHLCDLVKNLNYYPIVSKRRSGAIDYLCGKQLQKMAAGWKTPLVQRIYCHTGINPNAKAGLATGNSEGIYLLEEVLLRQRGKVLSEYPINNSSGLNTLFFILPSWPSRFENSEFKSVLETSIYRESPVHLHPKIIYLDREEMSIFERCYHAWLNAMTKAPLFDVSEIENGSFSGVDKYNLELLDRLSSLLLQFCQDQDSLLDNCLQRIDSNDLKRIILPWLGSDLLVNEIVNKQGEERVTALKLNLGKKNTENNESNAKDISQKLLALCQMYLDDLIKPFAIGENETMIGKTFRIGFTNLPHLKPVFEIGDGIINPSGNEEKVFSIQVGPANSINQA